MMLNPAQQQAFRQLFEAADDALLVVDAGGMVVALNPEAERLFGWTVAELLGTPLNRVIPPRFQQVTRSRPANGRPSSEIPLSSPRSGRPGAKSGRAASAAG